MGYASCILVYVWWSIRFDFAILLLARKMLWFAAVIVFSHLNSFVLERMFDVPSVKLYELVGSAVLGFQQLIPD